MSEHHELETWPGYFEAVWIGDKTAELRENDRDFQAGDTFTLLEFLPDEEVYTGRKIGGVFTNVVTSTRFGLREGYAMLSMRRDWKCDPQGVLVL